MYIQFVFTDWQAMMVGSKDGKYPETRTKDYRLELYSLKEIESIMTKKIRSLEAIADLPEEELPHCTRRRAVAV